MKKDKNLNTSMKIYSLFITSGIMTFLMFLVALLFIAFYSEATDNLGLLIGLIISTVIFIGSLVTFILLYKRGSLYERNKALNAISVVEKIYDDFDFEHFKQTLLDNDVEIKDDIYNIPFKRNVDFFLKLKIIESNNFEKEAINVFFDSIKINPREGTKSLLIKTSNYSDELKETLRGYIEENLKNFNFINNNTYLDIYIYDEVKKQLISLYAAHKLNPILISPTILQKYIEEKEELKKEIKARKIKPLYEIKSKTVCKTLLILGTLLAIASFVLRLIPFSDQRLGAALYIVGLVLFFIGTGLLFFRLYKSVTIIDIVTFFILSAYFFIIPFFYRQTASIITLVFTLVLLPLFIVRYILYKQHNRVCPILLFLIIFGALFEILDISFINENDLRLYLPAAILAVIVTIIIGCLLANKKTRKYFFKGGSSKKQQVGQIVLILFSSLLLTFISVYFVENYINFAFAAEESVIYHRVEIIDKRVSGGRATTYYFDFVLNENEYTVSVPSDYYKAYEIGDDIIISYYEGGLDIPFFYFDIGKNSLL